MMREEAAAGVEGARLLPRIAEGELFKKTETHSLISPTLWLNDSGMVISLDESRQTSTEGAVLREDFFFKLKTN